jgi:hypothetical protein
MKQILCDRCRKELVEMWEQNEVKLNTEHFDLCDDCYESLRNHLKGRCCDDSKDS